jgi:cobalt-zinc-cadmium efflux system outer membrane protein
MKTELKNFINRILFACVITASISLNAMSQDTARLSLSAIILKIETNYPQILAFDGRIKSIKATVEGARSQMAPEVSASLNRFPYHSSLIQNKNDPMNQAGIMIGVQQSFINPSKLNAKKNYLSSLSSIEESNREWTKNELRREAKLFYYQRYVAENKVAIIRESQTLLKQVILISESKYQYNQTELSTLFKSKAKLKEFSNAEVSFNYEIIQSNIVLNTLMNRPQNVSFLIDSVIELKPYHKITTDTADPQRSDITAIDKSINSMKLNQKYSSFGRKPDFGIRADHAFMFGMPNQYSIMGSITIPIVPWASKSYKSDAKSMGFKIEEMQKEKEALTLTAKQMIGEKLAMLMNERIQLDNFKDTIIPFYKKSYEASLLSYNQNTLSLFIVLDALEMLLMKQMEYLDKYFLILSLEADLEYEKEIK